MNKKLIIAAVLTGSLILGVTACSKKEPSPEANIIVSREGNRIVMPEGGEYQLDPDDKDGLCNVTFYIKNELLYVSLSNKAGKETWYKTQIHADGLFVLRPGADGMGGTMQTAFILRGNQIIYMFSHSYIDEPVTKGSIEEQFGSVSIVKKPIE